MARAVTSDELALLRSDHQRSILYLAIYKPGVIYSARVNQSTFGDPVTEIIFDGGSGTLASVLVGMTMLVGSSAGADDKGKIYIRKTPGAATFYINPTSEIDWEDNDYLTVLDDFELRSKQPSVAGGILQIDWDLEYNDQHEDFDPVSVMGAHAVLKLTGSTVNFSPVGSDSWVSGSTISAYLWAAPGASATANLNTATPTITYNAAGWYRVSLTVTAANGKTATGYRRVYVYDADNLPVENFELVKCTGDYDNGGWEFEVTLFDEADIADVFPGALCLLFAEDWYGSTAGSLGALAGYENLICMGRIDGETIDYDGQVGTVTFIVNGPQGWMKKITSSPATFTAAGDQPSTWSEFASPTVDKALFHLLHWRSNTTQILDVRLSGDTRRLPEIDLTIGYLWSQIESLAERRMLARGCCDRFGRLFVEIPGQLLETADRSGITTVMAITKDDFTGKVNIEYQCPRVGLAELAGLLDDTPEQVIMSRAPGIIPKREGSFESWDGLVFDNQEHANALSGLFLARENNPYPYVDINLGQNNRFMDVVPNQYVTLSVVPADNPRGITWTNKKLIVKRIQLQHNAKAGMLTTDLECEADTDGPAGVTFIPPQPIEENIDDGLDPGDFPIFPEPNINFPPFNPTPPFSSLCRISANGAYKIYPNKYQIEMSEVENIRTLYLHYPCEIRDTGGYPTRLRITGLFQELDAGVWKYYNATNDWYILDAIDESGGLVAHYSTVYQVNDTTKDFAFDVGGNKVIWGFKLQINVPIGGMNFDTGFTFTFDSGAEGWEPAPPAAEGDPQVPVSHSLGEFVVSGGALKMRNVTQGWHVNSWVYFPENDIFAKSGSSISGLVSVPGNCFIGLGVLFTDNTWVWAGWNGNNPANPQTISKDFSGSATKQVKCFQFNTNQFWSASYALLYDFTVHGWSTDEEEETPKRIWLSEYASLYNVCPPNIEEIIELLG